MCDRIPKPVESVSELSQLSNVKIAKNMIEVKTNLKTIETPEKPIQRIEWKT